MSDAPFRIRGGPRHVPHGSNLTHVQGSAVISEDGLYRYRLDRWWGEGPRVAWVMLNPSTADADVDDPTIRRCIAFTRAWGYDGLTVVNLYPLRATDPKALAPWLDGDAGEEMLRNLDALIPVTGEAPLVMAAWGVNSPNGDAPVRSLTFARWHHLGLTKDGHPRHPLYVKGDTKPIPWAVERGGTE